MSLKANHPTLSAQVQQWFKTAQSQGFEGIEHSHDRRVEAAHHRQEIRQVWAVPVSQMGELYKQQHSRWIKNRSDGGKSASPHRIERLVRCSFI